LLGHLDEAKKFVEHSLQSSLHQPGLAAYVHCLLGDIAMHPDHFDAESATPHYQKALTLAESRGMRPLVAQCHSSMGQLYRHLGKLDETRRHLAAATSIYRDIKIADSALAPAETE
jgi:tetratricopeptide (TPR) repeat protein